MTDAFLVAACADCARNPVLLVWDMLGAELITRCIHCDAQIVTEEAWEASPEELRTAGYDVGPDPSAQGKRGCRDGHCGVRQPDR